MQYTASVNIIVLCYLAHCTHVLQGLDIVTFSGFKKIWTQRRDQWISDNPFAIFGKTAWLSVWTEAFLEAMKESSIKALFRATGVVPFNPDVVTPNMMAPSVPHSSHGELPLPLASPVKKLIKYHHTIIHQSERALSPTPIHPSQDVRMFELAVPPAPRSMVTMTTTAMMPVVVLRLQPLMRIAEPKDRHWKWLLTRHCWQIDRWPIH